jgi:tellurite resistance protein
MPTSRFDRRIRIPSVTFTLSDALEERWAEYVRFREQNAHFSAFVRLGEIANCVRHAEASSKVRSRWKGILEEIDISTDVLRSIKVEALETIERLERILGIGDTCQYEEAMLVITFRVEIDMLVRHGIS